MKQKKYKAEIKVRLKKDVLDPQGQAIESALKALGIKEVEDIRQGKIFDVSMTADNKPRAEKIAQQCCDKLLVNEVIEDAEYAIYETDEDKQ